MECLQQVQPCSGHWEKSREQHRTVSALTELVFHWAVTQTRDGYISWVVVSSLKGNKAVRGWVQRWCSLFPVRVREGLLLRGCMSRLEGSETWGAWGFWPGNSSERTGVGRTAPEPSLENPEPRARGSLLHPGMSGVLYGLVHVLKAQAEGL